MKRNKTLLKEDQMRRFSKLAGYKLNEDKLHEMFEEDEELPAEESAMKDEEPDADVGADQVENLVQAIADAIEEATDVSVEVNGGADEELPAEEPAMKDEETKDEELSVDECRGRKSMTQEQIVQEVTRRVAARILKERKAPAKKGNRKPMAQEQIVRKVSARALKERKISSKKFPSRKIK